MEALHYCNNSKDILSQPSQPCIDYSIELVLTNLVRGVASGFRLGTLPPLINTCVVELAMHLVTRLQYTVVARGRVNISNVCTSSRRICCYR
jgi:hypothetical protein